MAQNQKYNRRSTFKNLRMIISPSKHLQIPTQSTPRNNITQILSQAIWVTGISPLLCAQAPLYLLTSPLETLVVQLCVVPKPHPASCYLLMHLLSRKQSWFTHRFTKHGSLLAAPCSITPKVPCSIQCRIISSRHTYGHNDVKKPLAVSNQFLLCSSHPPIHSLSHSLLHLPSHAHTNSCSYPGHFVSCAPYT